MSTLVGYCETNSVDNPVNILRIPQKAIVCGRPLEIKSLDSTIEGTANQIMINKYDVFKSANEELSGNNDLIKTLEVFFYGETARDYGGLRKEFFRLCLQEIEEKYFVHGLWEEMVDDYNIIGVIFALSILQNGPLPQFLNAEIREQVFGSTTYLSCILAPKDGFNKLGLVDLFAALPMLVFLFQLSKSSILTRKKLIHLLSPNFSPNGSNQRVFENEIYEIMMKYVCETAAGRVPSITLESIQQFFTYCDNEPVLGFTLNPTINFTPVHTFKSKWDFTLMLTLMLTLL